MNQPMEESPVVAPVSTPVTLLAVLGIEPGRVLGAARFQSGVVCIKFAKEERTRIYRGIGTADLWEDLAASRLLYPMDTDGDVLRPAGTRRTPLVAKAKTLAVYFLAQQSGARDMLLVTSGSEPKAYLCPVTHIPGTADEFNIHCPCHTHTLRGEGEPDVECSHQIAGRMFVAAYLDERELLQGHCICGCGETTWRKCAGCKRYLHPAHSYPDHNMMGAHAGDPLSPTVGVCEACAPIALSQWKAQYAGKALHGLTLPEYTAEEIA